jgi:hypothetical protein
MARDNPPNPNGQDNDPFGGLTAAVLGPAVSEATAVLYSQLATAVGLAMQNIVSQQQTLNTINNAIATKALNLLAESCPIKALEEIHKQKPSDVADALQTLSKLIDTLNPDTARSEGRRASKGGE